MTNLQDKIAALKAGDYARLHDETSDDTQFALATAKTMLDGESVTGEAKRALLKDVLHQAAKVIVLEEQVRMLREAALMAKMFVENCGYEDSTTYAKLLNALAATDMGE